MSGAAPNVFMQPLGTDFAAAVVEGLRVRYAAHPPEALGRVTLIVNTSRMARRIKALFSRGPAGFLPRIVLITQVDTLLDHAIPPARAKLERHLQLAELLRPLLEARPNLGPRSALYPLSESLATLMDEMQGEGVTAEDIAALDVSDQSDHWAFAQTLISAAHSYVSALDKGMDSEARQRVVVKALIAQWATQVPNDPILLVGSTASRGTTALLMEAIAGLPQGGVLLPGFDPHMPDAVWKNLRNALKGEDHPQFRFARLLDRLGLDPNTVPIWHDVPNVAEDRARLLSLALRPAPITDAWRKEAGQLPDLIAATADVTLLETQDQREEALCIAMRLRKASEDGQTAALITPDRLLTRQVTATLQQWNIVPDDSAGLPLHLSAPGRFLRHCAELFMRKLDAELLLTVLKHPLTQTGGHGPNHGIFTQTLEDLLRKDHVPYPDAYRLAALITKAAPRKGVPEGMEDWGRWLCDALPFDTHTGRRRPLSDWLGDHQRLAETLSAGSPSGTGALWEKTAGQEARAAMTKLRASADHASEIDARDFAALVNSVLSDGEIRDRDAPHPGIMIWGTLEARVQGADLMILGSLNDGIWPESMRADPWLNRQMRHEAGLLLPDRNIGLAAHDFQQAMTAREVWITRATKLDNAETVPSRWVNRLKNLMSGTPSRHGPEALQNMTQRGQDWRKRAQAFETVAPVDPAPRAAPRPPVAARPRDFSVTEIRRLIRDPYAIYAKHCLRLRPLDPLVQEPDAPIRGIVIHDIMERFIRAVAKDDAPLTRDQLLATADAVLEESVPWLTARAQWRAGFARVADWIVATEAERQAKARPALMERETKGEIALPAVSGTLRGVADRIDLADDGQSVHLYDYKSGAPPSLKEQEFFDKQLLLEAAIIEQGGIEGFDPIPVSEAAYIGVGSNPRVLKAYDGETPAEALAGLTALIQAYLAPEQHFTARRMLRSDKDSGDYDHLARFGEWDDADPPKPEDLS